MFFADKDLIKVVLLPTIAMFALVSLFGLFLSVNYMKMDGNGFMSHCLFCKEEKSCEMNLNQHINIWRRMFTNFYQEGGVSKIPAFSILFIVSLFVFTQGTIFKLRELPSKKYKFYIRENPQTPLFNLLNLAFFEGIIHPKIY